MAPQNTLENYFAAFRKHIIGHQQTFETPFGKKKIVYADWTASGRAYRPIEDCLQKEIMPFIANTHSESTITGSLMSKAYAHAKIIIKQHVHANKDDVLIFYGSGMTGALNKLQRMLGMRVPERIADYLVNGDHLEIEECLRPVVFITEMEHHSNHLSWLETIATVEMIPGGETSQVDLEYFSKLLEHYKHRKNKIAAVTACSNVTGIETPYHTIAKMIHDYGGLCFVDFACSAPYVNINMHPQEPGTHLDAICFSPHKFLGGPGTPGVLIFNKKMYTNRIPDNPGGGTVLYSNPWKEHVYITDIEQREDGGTPPFLQGIKAAMCIRVKEEMGVANILKREEEILNIVFSRFSKIENIQILQGNVQKRLAVIAFNLEGAHYNLVVKILNDRFGIQTRGGCSCAGTYGHKLLQVDRRRSNEILQAIRTGDLSRKPGWVRISFHPVMINAEIDFIMDAIELTAANFPRWSEEYSYDATTNEYSWIGADLQQQDRIEHWYDLAVQQDALNSPIFMNLT